jgi:uncharacterized membrane protein YhaH (DUF805 family)
MSGEKEREMNERGDITGTGAMNEQEIGERLALIESMMQAGRKSTEYWGWAFLLWGIAYLVAVAWASFLPMAGARALAWPVTMIVAALLTIGIASKRTRNRPRSETNRGIRAIWRGVGLAHVASGTFLRRQTQIVIGALWWAAAIATCFVSGNAIAYIFLSATSFCMIGFGIYLMIRESREKAKARGGEVQHA